MPTPTINSPRWIRNEDGTYSRNFGGVTETTSDYNALTKEDLQEELKNRDLPVSGNKEELVERLEEADSM